MAQRLLLLYQSSFHNLLVLLRLSPHHHHLHPQTHLLLPHLQNHLLHHLKMIIIMDLLIMENPLLQITLAMHRPLITAVSRLAQALEEITPLQNSSIMSHLHLLIIPQQETPVMEVQENYY
jgi:hypothetical protein